MAPSGRPQDEPSISLSASRAAAFERLEQRVFLSSSSDSTGSTYLPNNAFRWTPGAYLSRASNSAPATIATSFVRDNAGMLGVTPVDVANPIVTDQYTDADTGTTHVYLRQRVGQVEIANANLNVNVARDGRIISIGGGFVKNAAAHVAASGGAASISVAGALRRAAGALQIVPASGAPIATIKTVTNPSGPKMRGSLRVSSFSQDDVPTKIQYIASADGTVKLAWNFVFRTPDGQHWYDASVSAADGATLATNDWADHLANYHASYDVYPASSGSPAGGARQIASDPWDVASSPYGWQDLNGTPGGDSNVTKGNNASAQDDVDGNNVGGFRPSGGSLAADGSGSLNFDFPVDLSQAPLASQSAAITNAYYWVNKLHDLHARYGFTEAAGNFQQVNYSGAGLANDAVQIDVQDSSIPDNSSFFTPVDGSPARLTLGLYDTASPSRDAAFDDQMLIHEFGHGVSARLTGGPSNANALSALQSSGMAEGWSDWWALMLLQTSDTSAGAKAGAYPFGAYSLGRPAISGAAAQGLRRYAYSTSLSTDPLTLGSYNASSEAHDAGEIWASTLWDMNWALISKYGFNSNIAGGYTPGGNSAGNILALQLVMDALKLQPANPTFTQSRDAILQADQALTGGANQLLLWQAFAKRGLGYSAGSGTDANSKTVTEAFDIPPALSNPYVTSSTGSRTRNLSPLGSMTFTFSEPMQPASFTTAADVVGFTGPAAASLKSQITGSSWSTDAKTLTVSFSPQKLSGVYTMTLGPDIFAADNGAGLDQNMNGVAREIVADRYIASATLNYRVGPDAAGYTATPTTPLGIDLHAGDMGVVTLLDNSDSASTAIDLGSNAFNFYGQTFTGSAALTVAVDGIITLGSDPAAESSLDNQLLNFSPSRPTIAPAWDDWRTDETANDAVLYKLDIPNNRLIVEWSEVTHTDAVATDDVTFQAILSLNTGSLPGDIVFNYPDMSLSRAGFSAGASAVVGIKGAGDAAVSGQRLLLSYLDPASGFLSTTGGATAVRISATSLSGVVFVDRNADGALNATGESGLAGITVYADANNNAVLDADEVSAVTDSAGAYTLSGVDAGSYVVRLLNPPAGYYASTSAATGTVMAGQRSAGVNFAEFPTTFAGTAAPDTFDIRTDPSDASRVQILLGDTILASAATNWLNAAPFTLNFSGGEGNDTLNIDAALQASPVFAGGNGSDTLNVNAGAFKFSSDAQLTTTSLTVNVAGADASVAFASSQHLSALNITGSGASATITAPGNGNVLSVQTLNITGPNGARLDIVDDDVLIDYDPDNGRSDPINTVRNQLYASRRNSNWAITAASTGIVSSAAAAQRGAAAIGLAEGSDFLSVVGPSQKFDGLTIDNTCLMLRYTWAADVNLDRYVNDVDVDQLSARFKRGVGGKNFYLGDLNDDGFVDEADVDVLNFNYSTLHKTTVAPTLS